MRYDLDKYHKYCVNMIVIMKHDRDVDDDVNDDNDDGRDGD